MTVTKKTTNAVKALHIHMGTGKILEQVTIDKGAEIYDLLEVDESPYGVYKFFFVELILGISFLYASMEKPV